MDRKDAAVSGLTDLLDLASARLGGRAVAASDDFFAPKEDLLKPERAVFVAGKYTERGKWMDGWESRRKRVPGHDWCVIRLGVPGVIRGFNVDTSHFNGNQPEACTIDAAALAADPAGDDLARPAGPASEGAWQQVLGRTPLQPSSEHVVEAGAGARGARFTHVRLNIHPDGGVARLRVFGEARPDWAEVLRAGTRVELTSAALGGLVVAASNMHFGSRHNLIMPDTAANMGDGWETRRRRGLTWADGRPVEHDWAVVRLARRGVLERIEVDTRHFKGNFPESCRVEACDAGEAALDLGAARWHEVVTRSALRADTNHVFERELKERDTPWTHVRLSIFPDGGISRLRVWGTPAA